MTSIRPQEARARLECERAELLQARDQTQQARAIVELDQQSIGRLSRMDAIQNQAMARAGETNRSNRLKRIAAALIRIDTDTFGFCVDCGEAIEARRLTADLTIPTCLDCARG